MRYVPIVLLASAGAACAQPEADAKAALELARAKARAAHQPRPVPVSTPEPDCGPGCECGPGCRCADHECLADLAAAQAKAAKGRRVLAVWVGVAPSSYPAVVRALGADAVHCRLKDWKGDTHPALYLRDLSGQWWRDKEPTASGVRQALTPPPPAPAKPVSPSRISTLFFDAPQSFAPPAFGGACRT